MLVHSNLIENPVPVFIDHGLLAECNDQRHDLLHLFHLVFKGRQHLVLLVVTEVLILELSGLVEKALPSTLDLFRILLLEVFVHPGVLLLLELIAPLPDVQTDFILLVEFINHGYLGLR